MFKRNARVHAAIGRSQTRRIINCGGRQRRVAPEKTIRNYNKEHRDNPHFIEWLFSIGNKKPGGFVPKRKPRPPQRLLYASTAEQKESQQWFAEAERRAEAAHAKAVEDAKQREIEEAKKIDAQYKDYLSRRRTRDAEWTKEARQLERAPTAKPDWRKETAPAMWTPVGQRQHVDLSDVPHTWVEETGASSSSDPSSGSYTTSTDTTSSTSPEEPGSSSRPATSRARSRLSPRAASSMRKLSLENVKKHIEDRPSTKKLMITESGRNLLEQALSGVSFLVQNKPGKGSLGRVSTAELDAFEASMRKQSRFIGFV